MMRSTERLVVAAAVASCFWGCEGGTPTAASQPQAIIIGAGDIRGALAQFRAALGEPNNAAVRGQQPGGRREINWDGVPAAVTNTDTFPGVFFNVNSPRGVVFTSRGSGFRVSDTNFADVNASYGSQFAAFTPRKTFSAVGSSEMEVTFQVAGGTQAARSSGFGVVFSDVDRRGSAFIELFGDSGSLGTFDAPAAAGPGGFSFVGVAYGSPVVTRVRIVSGRAALSGSANDISGGGEVDLVVMDDFLYGEPQAR